MLRDLVDIIPFILASAFAIFLLSFVAAGAKSLVTALFVPIPVSHKIAVIGLPRAGKTTLITAMFDMIQRGVHVDQVRLHGMETIKTVNKYIAALNSKGRIGPTKEKDIFVFRFSYLKRRRLLPRLYDVEVADFPGEFSQRILNTSGGDEESPATENEDDIQDKEFEYTLFNKEFFSWIGASREYLFIIDLSSIYSSPDVRRAVADVTARIRASWQVIEDAVSERGIGSSQGRPIHLVFSKIDSLKPAYEMNSSILELRDSSDSDSEAEIGAVRDIKNLIKSSGTTNNLIGALPEGNKLIKNVQRDNSVVFLELIAFFKSRANSFGIIYTSMTMVDSEGERLGVRKVLEACLP